MKKLNTFVHVHNDDGTSHVFGPNDTVPGWAVKKITNPGVWADEPDAEPELEGEPSESWTVAQLQAFAKSNDIDLGDATKKADILAAIQLATEQGNGDTPA
ncbi:hypothetical protein [Nocardia sp. CY41]|uniref:hypothetical protein n=1 Tax=Nocardia sp. CY41 TaxID=2608686 RepID=UPI00135CC8CB|nr:hypothetical protein [Nocardia sp. CY41]